MADRFASTPFMLPSEPPLARQISHMAGAKLDQAGCIVVDEHQQTMVSGLFAAGDMVEGLDQIAVAAGQAAKAATAIHNLLPG